MLSDLKIPSQKHFHWHEVIKSSNSKLNPGDDVNLSVNRVLPETASTLKFMGFGFLQSKRQWQGQYRNLPSTRQDCLQEEGVLILFSASWTEQFIVYINLPFQSNSGQTMKEWL
jgi:hypothetical protein